jgi:hypothetical protein
MMDYRSVYVESGALVEKPPCPSEHHRFDYATKQWTDPRTLQDHQSAKWLSIKQARDTAEFGGFTWAGSTFDSSPQAVQRISGAVQMAMLAQAAGQAFGIDWTLADNTVRTLSGADMIAVGLALGQHVAACHVKARALRAQIEAAATVAQVEAVGW